jgi:uncharacterized protein YndB with AHSA1/START domain
VATEVVVEREMWIDAPPDVVFPFLIEPDKMIRWMGFEAEADPQPGGVYRVRIIPNGTASGRFVEVSPPDRVVFTWGWEGNWNPMGPGKSTVEVTLISEGSGTKVQLRHSGLPADQETFHVIGWDHYLPRFQIVAAGKSPEPDAWSDGPPKEALEEIARFMP